MEDKVGVIGLGAMGGGMAGSLRRAGCRVHVVDVRPGVAETFAAIASSKAPHFSYASGRHEVIMVIWPAAALAAPPEIGASR